MTLREYFLILKQGWVAILICTVLGVIAGSGLAAAQPREYESAAGIYVSIADNSDPGSIFQMSEYTRSQMVTYADLAHAPATLDAARKKMETSLTNEELSEMVSVDIPSESYVMEVKARATDPQLSQEAAQAAADSLKTTVEDLAPQHENQPVVIMESIRPATVPDSPETTPWSLWAGAGAIIGLILGLLIAFGINAIRHEQPTARHTHTTH